MPEKGIQSLGPEDPLEKGMATHSSILAQRTPWTEKPVGYSPWDHKSGTRPKRLNNKQSSSYSVVPKLAAFASCNLSAMQATESEILGVEPRRPCAANLQVTLMNA